MILSCIFMQFIGVESKIQSINQMAQEVVIPNEEVLSKQILILDMIFFFWGGVMILPMFIYLRLVLLCIVLFVCILSSILGFSCNWW